MSGEKNLFNILISEFLKKQRESLGVAAKDIAADFGISYSSYRQIESASTPIPVESSVRLKSIFKDTAINLGSLTKLIAAAHYVNKYLGKEFEQLREVYLEIKKIDTNLAALLTELEIPADTPQNHKTLETKLRSSDEQKKLVDFLTKLSFGENFQTQLRQRMSALYDNTPSFHNEFLYIQLDSIQNHVEYLHRMPGSYDLKPWEDDNAKSFTQYLTVVTNSKRITEFPYYTYDYIYLESFEQYLCIVLDMNEKETQVVAQKKIYDFLLEPQNRPKGHSIEDCRSLLEKKVKVKVAGRAVGSLLRKDIVDRLNTYDNKPLKTVSEKEFQEVILYDSKTKGLVGVMHADEHVDYEQTFPAITNWQVKEVHKLFNRYWNFIE